MAAKASSTGVYHSRYDTYEHHSRFVDPGFVYDALLAKTVGPRRDARPPMPICRSSRPAISPTRWRNMSSEVKKLADDERAGGGNPEEAAGGQCL